MQSPTQLCKDFQSLRQNMPGSESASLIKGLHSASSVFEAESNEKVCELLCQLLPILSANKSVAVILTAKRSHGKLTSSRSL